MKRLTNRSAMDVFEDVLDSLRQGNREQLDPEDLEWLRPAYNALRKLERSRKQMERLTRSEPRIIA